jgi:hypothetical protein
MKVDMRNVYILCAVILATILVAYYLFTQNRLEMFTTIKNSGAEINEAIRDYYLKKPTLSAQQIN